MQFCGLDEISSISSDMAKYSHGKSAPVRESLLQIQALGAFWQIPTKIPSLTGLVPYNIKYL